MEDDCFVYKCSFYAEELMVVSVLAAVVMDRGAMKEVLVEEGELYSDDLALREQQKLFINVNTHDKTWLQHVPL